MKTKLTGEFACPGPAKRVMLNHCLGACSRAGDCSTFGHRMRALGKLPFEAKKAWRLETGHSLRDHAKSLGWADPAGVRLRAGLRCTALDEHGDEGCFFEATHLAVPFRPGILTAKRPSNVDYDAGVPICRYCLEQFPLGTRLAGLEAKIRVVWRFFELPPPRNRPGID